MSQKKKRQENQEEIVCQKNQEFVLEIENIGNDGEGIARVKGYTLFVKDALVGDIVRVKVMKTKKRYGYAKLLEIIEASPWRVEPACAVARQCGGCQIQHCSYEKQLAWKSQKVADCITRIGGIPVVNVEKESMINNQDMAKESDVLDSDAIHMEPILRMDKPYHYRNKAQFPIGYDKEGKLVAGFYAGHTHDIIPCTDCTIQHPCNKPILETILEFMQENHITAYQEKTHTGLVRHILTRVGRKTGEVMVCLVINGTEIPNQDELVKEILNCPINGISDEVETVGEEEVSAECAKLCIKSICININEEKTNVILGEQIATIYGQAYIEDEIGKIRYQISPLSFYQVNPKQTEKLYQTALEFAGLQGGEVVWDLYCGIGTISLFLAQRAAKVCGVEIIPQAIEDARKNAALNGFTNTEFFVGAAEEVVPEQYAQSEGALQADVVMLDPPRKGCDEKLLETVVRMRPGRIVYVSCDPATLARDLKYLCENGYGLKRVRACDMFGHSGHVETIALLTL